MSESDDDVEETKQVSYDHPVYKEISLTNGKINKMKKDEVKSILTEIGLDSRLVVNCASLRSSCMKFLFSCSYLLIY